MTIVEWATAGLKLANENGKTVDDLIVYLKNAEGLSRFFDKLFPQPVSKADVFGKSEQLREILKVESGRIVSSLREV